MDDVLFEEILNEIESMTSEEYWTLYQDAQKLSDFNPPHDSDWEPISFPAYWSDVVAMSISYSDYHTSTGNFEIKERNDYSNREDILCPEAA
jgi:hypothetical protein